MHDAWLKRPGTWLEGTGPYADIAVSSRIRLARNLAPFRYPPKATQESGHQVYEAVSKAAAQVAGLKDALRFEMNQLPMLDRRFLVERHLISHDLAEQDRFGSAAIIDPEERASLMVNEEDHLRIQAICSGLNLADAWAAASKIDQELGKGLTYAYSPSWGHLTCCPTNTGTGLRASVMLHLPALVFERKAERTLQRASQLGLVVRGLYGEGSDVKSVFFQVSNQVTLGKTEEEIIENVVRLTRQLSDQERQAREALMAPARKVRIEDGVWRAYGVLRYARALTTAEATDLLSALRLGVELGVVQGVSMATVNLLMVFAQSAHIQKRLGREMDETHQAEQRAELFRLTLKTP